MGGQSADKVCGGGVVGGGGLLRYTETIGRKAALGLLVCRQNSGRNHLLFRLSRRKVHHNMIRSSRTLGIEIDIHFLRLSM